MRDISIWRFVVAKSAENWALLDQFSLLQQIGVIAGAISGFEVAPAPGEP